MQLCCPLTPFPRSLSPPFGLLQWFIAAPLLFSNMEQDSWFCLSFQLLCFLCLEAPFLSFQAHLLLITSHLALQLTSTYSPVSRTSSPLCQLGLLFF